MSKALLSSLQRLEEELQKAIKEVRLQATQLSDGAPFDKPEVWCTENCFQNDPPKVMKHVVRDDPVVHEESTIYARQQAASLHNVEGSERLNLSLNPYFMELWVRSGGALGGNDIVTMASLIHTPMTKSKSRALLEEMMEPSWGVVTPHSRTRVSWDVVGTGLILMDVVLLPVALAWNVDTKPWPFGSTFDELFLQILAWLNLFFWPLDLCLNLSTGFHRQGMLIMKRSSIAKHYCRHWLGFDLSVVIIDWALSITSILGDQEGWLRTLRSARYLRALRSIRILRIVKSRKVNVIIENWVIGLGQQWLILAFNVLRMLLSILLTAHLLACSWFAVGTFESAHRESWIDLASVSHSPGHVQYIHALAWVVQPPSIPELSVLGVDSFTERIVSIFMVVVTVLIIGSSLSILTGTLQEIRTINNERSRKRRELRTFLHSQAAPTELVMRIMSFADYKLERYSPVSYDQDLISPLLEAELAVWQKGHVMQLHPMFQLIGTAWPKVFADICCALTKQLYYEGESAFLAGLLAESMYITSQGSFAVFDSQWEELERFSGHQFFSEVALYVDTVMHDCTLQIESFAEVLILTGKNVSSILLHSPICASMFVEYAKEFIATYSRTAVQHQKSVWGQNSQSFSSAAQASWKLDMTCANRALKCNSVYMDMHMQRDKILNNVVLSDANSEDSRPVVPLASAGGSMDGDAWHNWSQDLQPMHQEHPMRERSPTQNCADVLVSKTLAGNMPSVDELQEAFVEMHPEKGLHAMYSQVQEQEKAVCACFCLSALVADDYDTYTEPQQDAAKLHRSQWQQFRDILSWAQPDEDMLEAVFFVLAVRSIGKCRAVTRQLPREAQKPEDALLHVLDHFPNMVPSYGRLSTRAKDMVSKALVLQQGFSFPQMLQGENVPANLLQLQRFLRENGGETMLKFYMVFLLGFLSALQGGMGSLFMTHQNAKNIYLGLNTVQYVLDKNANFLHWMYIYMRGNLLTRVARSEKDLAILRLACLCRARNGSDYDHLEHAYQQLDDHQQYVLTSHFLASGINSPAIVFEFLPLCLENAKRNPNVSVPGLLDVLVSLIESIWASEDGSHTTTVDLSSLGGFILVVSNPFVFLTCLSRSKLLKVKAHDYQLDLTEDNWNRINDKPSDLEAVARQVREVLQLQKRPPSDFISM